MKRYTGAILKRLDKAGILRYFNLNFSLKIGTVKFIIPVINGTGYQLLISSEEWALNLYDKLLKIQPGTFVDVGANNGQTLLKIASVQNELSYVCFEPNPVCFYYLKKLADKNKLINCILFPVGLHYQNKIVSLIHDNDFASGATILENLRENNSRYKLKQNVALMNGDEIFTALNSKGIGVIKADVEGAELEVIKGLQQTIKKYKPFISLEILPVYNPEKETGRFRKQRQDELLRLMFSLDYRMFRINEQNEGLVALDSIEVHSNMHLTNYLFVPSQLLEAVNQNFTIAHQ